MDSERIRNLPESLAGYFGNKGRDGVWQRIINEIPPHKTFVEGFAGSAAVWRHIRPAAQSFLVDRERLVIEAWRDVSGRDLSTGLICGEFLDLVGAQCSAIGVYTRPDSLLAAIADPDTVCYLDPPYLFELRGDRRYKQDLGFELEHRSLLRWCRGARCRVLISGYASELYDQALHGWRRLQYPTMTRGGVREEVLWMNFGPASSLHDARFAGGGFRERERIKRRAESWASMLKAMSPAERDRVMLSVLDAWREASSGNDGR